MSQARLRAYAKLVRDVAKRHDIDTFTIVALIHNESRWRSSTVSRDGEDFGLGQVRARYLPGCDRTMAAAKDTSASCLAVKARLSSVAYNIRVLGGAINAWRKTCRKRTGRRALLRRWLHGVGGMGKPPSLICGMRKVKGRWRDIKLRPELRKILRYRKRLIRQWDSKHRRRRKRKRRKRR